MAPTPGKVLRILIQLYFSLKILLLLFAFTLFFVFFPSLLLLARMFKIMDIDQDGLLSFKDLLLLLDMMCGAEVGLLLLLLLLHPRLVENSSCSTACTCLVWCCLASWRRRSRVPRYLLKGKPICDLN